MKKPFTAVFPSQLQRSIYKGNLITSTTQEMKACVVCRYVTNLGNKGVFLEGG